MRRNENFEKVIYVFRLFDFLIFFFPSLFLLIGLLLGLLAVKKKISLEQLGAVAENFSLIFHSSFLDEHISGSIRPITLI